jgi:hypothetical protein
MAGQPPRPKLASHHIPDADHFVFDVVNGPGIIAQAQRFFLRQDLGH